MLYDANDMQDVQSISLSFPASSESGEQAVASRKGPHVCSGTGRKTHEMMGSRKEAVADQR